MLENLKRTSMAGFLGLLSPWVIVALVVALMAASGLAGARLNGQRWAAKYERLQHSYESAQSQAQAVAAQQTQANAEQSAQLDKTYYEEFQNATKNSDYWRARYLSERVPSLTKTAHCAETRTTGSVGDDTTADNSGIGQVDVSRAAIVELREHTDKMKAQIEYLQVKVTTDAQTINGVSDEK